MSTTTLGAPTRVDAAGVHESQRARAVRLEVELKRCCRLAERKRDDGAAGDPLAPARRDGEGQVVTKIRDPRGPVRGERFDHSRNRNRRRALSPDW